MVDEIIENISKKLVYISSDARNSSNRFSSDEESRHFMNNEKGYFSIGKKGSRGYEELFQYVKENIDQFDEKFSKRYVERLITDSIYELLRVESKKVVEESKKVGKNFYTELNKEFEEFVISTPIRNLELEIDELKIGKVSFSIFTPPLLPETDSENLLKARKHTEEKIYPLCKNKIMSKVKIYAIDITKAEELGQNKMEDALDIICFFGLYLKYPQGYRIQNYFDIQGKISPANMLLLVENPSRHNEVLPYLSKIGYVAPFTITSDFYKDMNELGLNSLNKILEKPQSERTDIEKRIISAVKLSGSSFNYRNHYEAFLKLMISLEALFLDDREPKKDNLAERIAFIITESPEERIKVFNAMRNLYEIRSSIVHEGIEEVSKNDRVQLQYYAHVVIITMMKMYEEENIQTINQLKEWVLKRKFS